MTSVAEGTILFIALLTLLLTGLVLYLILLLGRVEIVLHRVLRALRNPEVRRDWNGRPLKERN